MKNHNTIFVVFSLSIAVGILGVYSIFLRYFDGSEFYKKNIVHLNEQVARERLNNSLLTYQIKDFQQSVAQLLPDQKKLQGNYELQSLASVVRLPASDTGLELSSVIHEKGKKYFNKSSYDAAIREFYKLLEQYPLSRHAVEAHFFIAESYFLKGDFRNSLSAIDQMVTHFPQHDLTGFILLRMGQISEYNNQIDEASEIYQTVMKNFSNKTLHEQAMKLAEGVEY